MSSLAKIPVTVITGFLGSGKTTLIRHLMTNAGGRKLAVLVNEFGSEGVDGEILKSCADANCPEENIVELANGCICCTVADDFIPTMQTLLARPTRPDHILIETSGLALPKPLLKAFDWPEIRSRITVDGVIALADAEAVAAGRFAPNPEAVEAQRKADESVEHETPLSEVFEDQICCADIVLLTKADLAGQAGVEAAKLVIAAETSRAVPILAVTDGAIDPQVILGLNAAAEDDLAARPSHHDGEEEHEHDDFASVVVDLPEVTDIDALVASIARLAREQNVLRAKGYLAVKGKPMRLLVQSVGERVRHQFDKPWGSAPRQSKLVVIGEQGDINEGAIRAGLGSLMHVVFRESHGLEETATAVDLGQDPADLVVLSFSDSDLSAFAAGWRRGRKSLPSLRLANLVALRHPLSVDTYVERTLTQARGILVRLIGGESYWPYGINALHQLAKARGIALAVLPADGRDDARLDALSTVPVSTLRRLRALCDVGGAVAAQVAIAQLTLASGLYAGPVFGETEIPDMGFYDPAKGALASLPPSNGRPHTLVTFYRSYLTSADTGPVDALIGALREKGFDAFGAFATSLKVPGIADWLRAHFAEHPPAAIINATAFSAMADDGTTPFDAASCPVFQVALSTARREGWVSSLRGLSPADLAMHVVLPEVDGRLLAGVVSFKSPGVRDGDLQFAHLAHQPDRGRVSAIVDRVSAWHRLAATPARDKNVAIILSSYPGRPYQIAHAVGLDALASTDALLGDLDGTGFDVERSDALAQALGTKTLTWDVAAYRAALRHLPRALQENLGNAWGAPEDDPQARDGAFHFAAIRRGKAIIAVQPERGEIESRDADYHDLSRIPRHAYVAFYLWLRSQGVHALVHMGAHGTLEWLPGKSVALSDECWPEALIGDVPVIYPFIVNDPGEAAQAKRRIGAVTLGHLPPPLAASAVPPNLLRLEQLLDEYSTADGLDPARRERLVSAIRDEARAAGVEDDLGLATLAAPGEAIPRIDRFVCDLKESQFGDGLHVFGRGDCGEAERDALFAALSGRRVAPGPAGSPHRGRRDVLPTGRNLFAVDPRGVPTRAAHAQGIKLAEELLRRHLQDHGDWPEGLVVDLWGSATMRTAGEGFAMALHLAGVAPRWDGASGRLTGFEIIPLASLGRPRVDVTLRVSGLFRDVFTPLAQLFEAASEALSQRDFEGDENPYLARAARVFGPRPGQYGAGMALTPDVFTNDSRKAAGEAWLSASSWSFATDGAMKPDRDGIAARLTGADTFVHVQDLPETDLLLASDYAAHEAGVAAAAASLGSNIKSLYHLDATRPEAPRARTLPEEISRVVRSRAANPKWISGMMRHGFRGAAEISATLEHMAAFAHLADAVPSHLFDLYYDATLGNDDVSAFLARENPQALAAIEDFFRSLDESSLWVTRRNSILASLREAS